LNRVKANLANIQSASEDKARCVGRLLALEDLLQHVTVTLENVSDTLADMHLFPLEVEVVAEDVKKLQVGHRIFHSASFYCLITNGHF
jgi:hypothetical protein